MNKGSPRGQKRKAEDCESCLDYVKYLIDQVATLEQENSKLHKQLETVCEAVAEIQSLLKDKTEHTNYTSVNKSNRTNNNNNNNNNNKNNEVVMIDFEEEESKSDKGKLLN